jgi:hypothetical protein
MRIRFECWPVSFVGMGQKTKFKKINRTHNDMGAQFYGASPFITEEMFEDIKSEVTIDELSTQEIGMTTKKRIMKWNK